MKSILISIRPKWVEKICHKIGKDTNRRFIGIELDEKYFEIAKNRISEANDIAKIIENKSKIEVEE